MTDEEYWSRALKCKMDVCVWVMDGCKNGKTEKMDGLPGVFVLCTLVRVGKVGGRSCRLQTADCKFWVAGCGKRKEGSFNNATQRRRVYIWKLCLRVDSGRCTHCM